MSAPGVRHVPPFFCPYCGEQDISPHGEDAGGWRCGSCLRAFSLRTAPRQEPAAPQEPAGPQAPRSTPPASAGTVERSTATREVTA